MIFHKKQYWKIASGAVFLSFFLISGSDAFMARGIEVNPRVSIQESYDDNVTFIKDNPISDFITSLLVGLGLRQEGRTHLLDVEANVTGQFFVDKTSFNNTSEDMKARFKKDLSQYDQFTVTNSFTHAEEPRSFEDAFGRVSGRYSTYHNILGVGYRRDLNNQLAWDLRYANDLTHFSRKDLSDSTMNSVGTGVDYALNSAAILSTNYDYSKRDFNPGSSSTEHEASVNVRRFLTAQLYFDLQSGADFIDAFHARHYVRPLFRAALTNDVDKNTQTGISFEKHYTTNSYTQDLFNVWRVSIDLMKQLTDRVKAIFAAFYGNGTYTSTSIREKFTGASMGGSFDLTKNTKVNLNYAFSQYDSTQGGNSYTKNVVSFGFTIEF